MRFRFLIFFCLIFLSSSYVSLVAQEGNNIVVEVSKEKTNLNGKTYYLHTVKKGENIYRISKAYNVTQKDVIIANPEAISGRVNEGQVIKIPVESSAPHSISQIESDNFIYHVTEEQQTVFFLTQKYSISKEELYKYNPELEFSSLQVGQVVRIPKKKEVSTEAETFQPLEGYIEYKVRRKETCYSIATEHNISVDELIKANPTISPDKVKSGTIIRIPKRGETKFDTKSLVARKDSLLKQKTDTLKTTIVPELIKSKPYSGVLNIALLLPFSIEDMETRAKLDSIAALKKHNKPIVQPELFPRSVYSLEFYQGFLIAVDSLKKTGISVKIHTFDTGRDAAKVNSILSKPQMADLDLIIGPLFNEGIEKANEFSYSKQVKLVSPIIKDNDGLSSNPYSFQLIPSTKASVDVLVNYINSLEKKNIILIESTNQEDKNICRLFKERLDTLIPGKYSVYKYDISLSHLSKLFSDKEDNVVIVPSVNEAYMFSVLSKLNLDAKEYSIKVFGLPESARSKNIVEYLHNLEFHYFSPFYYSYSEPSVMRFRYLYNRAYSFDPQEFPMEGFNFAMLGYDMGIYFLSILGKTSESIEQTMKETNIQPIHMKIRFEKDTVNGGFLNKEVQILQFTKDYYVKKVY